MEKEDFHIDMSGRIYENKNIGIALVGAKTKINFGCVIKRNLLKLIKKELFKDNIFKDSAKLYAICIYLLLKKIKDSINILIICNDEDFDIVKNVLFQLLKDANFEIINISEFRKRLGRNIGSLADNYANIYRRKALKPHKWSKGKEIKVIEIYYHIIKETWSKISD
mgnify:CR=1 FL=1